MDVNDKLLNESVTSTRRTLCDCAIEAVMCLPICRNDFTGHQANIDRSSDWQGQTPCPLLSPSLLLWCISPYEARW